MLDTACVFTENSHTEETAAPGPAPDPASPWGKSRAKAQLKADLSDPNHAIHGMKPEDIHKSDPLYKKYKLANFKSNFERLKNNGGVEKKKKIPPWAQSRAKAFLKALLMNPSSQPVSGLRIEI